MNHARICWGGRPCAPAGSELNPVQHVELTESDLRRLGDVWPELETVSDSRRAAEIVVTRAAGWLSGRRRCERLVGDLYSFSRRIGQLNDMVPLSQFVLKSIAEQVQAQQAALALFDNAEGRLAIVATHGYPAVLVEDLRIAPGTGVIGEVFESRKSILVSDAEHELRSRPRRRRYRTGSFMALPLYTDAEGLGVLTFADRADMLPFTRADLTLARAMAAPAALALSSARLAGQVKDLTHVAAVDPLTSLFNRRYFEARIDEEIQRARRYGLDLALLVIDADDFKALNDVFGHLIGDRVLRTMADMLRRSVRAFDVCTRFGGEEFAILMPGSSAGSAVQSAERIRQRIERYRFDPIVIPAEVHPTISIGVAVLTGESSAQDLIARADRALYGAKAAGKNCVRLAPE
jgi:diguanylate cyclase (GGDEF)-like protein